MSETACNILLGVNFNLIKIVANKYERNLEPPAYYFIFLINL